MKDPVVASLWGVIQGYFNTLEALQFKLSRSSPECRPAIEEEIQALQKSRFLLAIEFTKSGLSEHSLWRLTTALFAEKRPNEIPDIKRATPPPGFPVAYAQTA